MKGKGTAGQRPFRIKLHPSLLPRSVARARGEPETQTVASVPLPSSPISAEPRRLIQKRFANHEKPQVELCRAAHEGKSTRRGDRRQGDPRVYPRSLFALFWCNLSGVVRWRSKSASLPRAATLGWHSASLLSASRTWTRQVARYAYLHTSEKAREFLRLWEAAPVNPGGGS